VTFCSGRVPTLNFISVRSYGPNSMQLPCVKPSRIFIADNVVSGIPANSWLVGSGPSGIQIVLKQRVITASLMALVFLGMLFLAPPLFFIVFAALVVLAAAWEWANFCGYSTQR